MPSMAVDSFARPLRDLRLSVTDRCNFRCTYCMPKEVFGRDYAFLPKNQILSFEELARLAAIFVDIGVRKIRLTGGEPLLRRNLPDLIAQLARLEGLEDITLTTNGSALASLAKDLHQSGLKRLTVSLDALDDTIFRAMNDVDFPVHRVLRGIETALEAGFSPVKINMVVKRGVNEDQIIPMARRFSGPQYILRFIEYMDVGSTNGWRMDDVVPAAEILRKLNTVSSLKRLPASQPGEVAARYQTMDRQGEIGVIASVTQPFCQGCNRARVSSDGQFFTCLFAGKGHDLLKLLRSTETNEELREHILNIWHKRDDRYSELRRELGPTTVKPEMSRLGG